MKKQNISVALYLVGNKHFISGNAAYDQLLAHQDIEYTYIPDVGSEEDPFKVIIPYHAVNYALIDRESRTVASPDDSICKEA